MHTLATLVGPAALVVKELNVDLTGGTDGRYVRIVGRKSGLIDWLLTKMGIDTTTVFEVYADHIKFTSSNLSGSSTSVIPLTAVSATSSGFFKPILYLIIGIPLLLCFLVGIIPIIYYFLHQSLMITVQAHSGGTVGIAFKRSVIEGVKVDRALADQIIDVINQLTLARQSK